MQLIPTNNQRSLESMRMLHSRLSMAQSRMEIEDKENIAKATFRYNNREAFIQSLINML